MLAQEKYEGPTDDRDSHRKDQDTHEWAKTRNIEAHSMGVLVQTKTTGFWPR